MALRGWRLFGVAGTIFAYVAGILLLSIISLNNPHQRRMRNGHYSDSYEVFKHRELGILSRRPPLQWCRELRYLTDPEKPHNIPQTTTLKTYNSLSGHFLKKYEKYLRKDSTSNGVTNTNVSFRKSNGDHTANIYQKIHNDNGLQPMQTENDKHARDIKYNNDDSKRVYYERLWPKTNNLRKKSVKPTEAPETGLTALASFPGSGNTWLRYLLQQATGIYTGSVYKDFGLLKSGFPAEYVCNSSVLVVKTHEWGPNAWQQFSRAILLVRDPDRSILAEFNRQSGGHVGFASPERYKRTKGRYWQQFVTNKLWAWEQMNLQWAKNFTGDVHIVYYDDLVDNVDGTLRDILHFLNFPVDKDLFNCAMSRKEGIYRRKKRIMAFDPYTPSMHNALEAKKREVYSALGRYKF